MSLMSPRVLFGDVFPETFRFEAPFAEFHGAPLPLHPSTSDVAASALDPEGMKSSFESGFDLVFNPSLRFPR